jgi:hypothetical protein
VRAAVEHDSAIGTHEVCEAGRLPARLERLLAFGQLVLVALFGFRLGFHEVRVRRTRCQVLQSRKSPLGGRFVGMQDLTPEGERSLSMARRG